MNLEFIASFVSTSIGVMVTASIFTNSQSIILLSAIIGAAMGVVILWIQRSDLKTKSISKTFPKKSTPQSVFNSKIKPEEKVY